MSGIYTTEGIVLRSFKYKESSMIADIFTQDQGLRSYVVSGVRSKKSIGKANTFYPLNIVELTAYPAQEDKLARIKEINYAHIYQHLNLDVIPTAVGTFLVEICRKSIKEKEPNLELYSYLKQMFMVLDSGQANLKSFHIKFLLGLSSHLGFSPYDNYSQELPIFDLQEGLFVTDKLVKSRLLSRSVSHNIHRLLITPVQDLHQLEINSSERDHLLEGLLRFYTFHIPNFGEIKSLDVLRTILS